MPEPEEPRDPGKPSGGGAFPRHITMIATFQPGRIVAYLAVVVAFVIAAWLAHDASNRAGSVARRADATAQETRRIDKRIIAIRNEQVAQLHAAAVASCAGRHKIAMVLRETVQRGIAQARQAERGPLAKLPGVKAAEEESIRSSRRFLRDLRGADCLGVPPLPTTKP